MWSNVRATALQPDGVVRLCYSFGVSIYCNIGERPYLTTKIITLSEFFNFVHQVSRLWYE
jgi:hypothetical protein